MNVGSTGDVAKQQAAEAARRRAEEARQKALEAARQKAAAEKAAKKAEAAKPAPTKDQREVSGLEKLKNAAKSVANDAVEALPWEKSDGLFGKIKDFAAKLTAADDAKTDAFMEKHQGAFGPQGQESLQSLADEGMLGAIDQQWGNMRDALEGFLGAKGDPQVAEAVVNQIADPTQIAQVGENTCTAATLQRSMAEANPAQYLQMAADLVTKGVATLPNGQELKVSEKNQQAIADKPLAERINMAFQAAAMDFANGKDSYDVTNDRSERKSEDMSASYAGLNMEQARKLNEAVLNAPTFDQDGLQADVDRRIEAQKDRPQDDRASIFEMVVDNVRSQLDAAKEAGAPGMFITMHAGSEQVGPRNMGERVQHYHMMMVKDMDEAGNVTLVDANGQELKMDKDQFGNAVSWNNDSEYGGIGNVGSMYGTAGTGGGRAR